MQRLLLFTLLLATVPAHAQTTEETPAVVQGHVTDESGVALPFANVQLVGTTAGAATDSSGRFRFITRQTGRRRLRASAVGFEPAERRIHIPPGDTLSAHLVLRAQAVELDEAVVWVRRRPALLDEATRLNPLEAVTTAGASGDRFRALKLLPGASAAGDGSVLLVRGGDKSETKVLLDDAPVTHPYKYESSGGGSFSTIPPFLTSGTSFSAGGFSARYGDALSGVLALESQGLPREQRYTVGLGLAAASLRAAVPIERETLGLHLSGNRSFTGALFRLNGLGGDYQPPPRSLDGNLSLIYRYSDAGQLKLFGFAERNRIGFEQKEASFEGLFENRATNQLYHARWRHTGRRWLASAHLSTNRHTNRQRFGALDLQTGDHATQLRLDVGRDLTGRVRLTAGALAERRRSTFEGTVPAPTGMQDPGTETLSLSERLVDWRTGAYVETHADLTHRLSLRAGLRANRTDATASAAETVFDPRLQLRYAFSEHLTGRLAWGRYHQFPAPYQLNPETGNPGLEAQRAQHLIAGLKHEHGPLLTRLSAYYKPYDRLVVEDPATGYTNAGDGYAYGLDTFARYGAFLETRLSGWAAYSFLRARRDQLRRLGERRVLQRGPTPQDVTHSLTLVGKVRVVDMLHAGGTFRWATGRPITPVTGSVPAPGAPQDAAPGASPFLPVEGPVGSERRPAFRRLDLQLSYYWPFSDGRAANIYLSLANALGRANVNGYDYNADYTERTPERSPYRRLVYAGVTVTF